MSSGHRERTCSCSSQLIFRKQEDRRPCPPLPMNTSRQSNTQPNPCQGVPQGWFPERQHLTARTSGRKGKDRSRTHRCRMSFSPWGYLSNVNHSFFSWTVLMWKTCWKLVHNTGFSRWKQCWNQLKNHPSVSGRKFYAERNRHIQIYFQTIRQHGIQRLINIFPLR